MREKLDEAFSAVFADVFGAALCPVGFEQVPNMPHVFLRLLCEDAVQIVTYTGGEPAVGSDLRAFTLRAGVTSLYRPVLPLKYGFHWLSRLCGLYIGKYPQTFQKEIWDRLRVTHYHGNDAASMTEAAEFALHWTKELMLPELDAVTDLPSALLFLRRRDYVDVSNEAEWISRRKGELYYMEDMLYFKTNYTGDFTELIQPRTLYEQIAARRRMLGMGADGEPYDTYVENERAYAKAARAKLDSILNDAEMRRKAEQECAYRLQVNLGEMLRFGQ